MNEELQKNRAEHFALLKLMQINNEHLQDPALQKTELRDELEKHGKVLRLLFKWNEFNYLTLTDPR